MFLVSLRRGFWQLFGRVHGCLFGNFVDVLAAVFLAICGRARGCLLTILRTCSWLFFFDNYADVFVTVF